MALKYITLANALRLSIRKDGQKGQRLPTEMELMKQYQVSRQTVRQALSILLEEGLIEKRQGSGTYIAGDLTASISVSKNIAIVTAQQEHSYPSLGRIQSLFAECGYHSQVYTTKNRISQERSILENLTNTPVRGLLAEGTRTAFPNPNQDLYEKLLFQGTSVLFVGDGYPFVPQVPCIGCDDYDGGFSLTRYLIAQGHKKIGGIFQSDDRRGQKRFYGCIQALCDYHIPFDDRRFLWYDSSQRSSLSEPVNKHLLLSYIQMQLLDCSAVICQDEETACQLIREVPRLGIRIPEQLSVVTFENNTCSEKSPVPITTLSLGEHDPWLIGAQSLVQLLQHKPIASQFLPWTLVRKDSDRSLAY